MSHTLVLDTTSNMCERVNLVMKIQIAKEMSQYIIMEGPNFLGIFKNAIFDLESNTPPKV